MTARRRQPMPTANSATVERRSDRLAPGDASVATRLWALLFAARYDQRVERGDAVGPGTALAAHYVRLLSRSERQDMASALMLLLEDAGRMPRAAAPTMRVPIHADAVERSAAVVEDVLARLLGPLPIRARGMARLRILLGDGRSPLYLSGHGTFAAAMRGVLAAL